MTNRRTHIKKKSLRKAPLGGINVIMVKIGWRVWGFSLVLICWEGNPAAGSNVFIMSAFLSDISRDDEFISRGCLHV